MADKQEILLIITGGTIDKVYDEVNAKLKLLKNSHLPDMLAQARATVKIKQRKLMLVDSLHITDKQRQQIANACQAAKQDLIVITHGTDTMALTGALLAKQVTGKTIVLTGAMIPYSFPKSDGLFNLGSAITAVQILDKGVYIAMNGQIFEWHNVFKNKKIGEFQSKEPLDQ